MFTNSQEGVDEGMVRRNGNDWIGQHAVCHKAVKMPRHTLFLVIVKYHVQDFLGTDIKFLTCFPDLWVPGLVLFSKPFLKRIVGKVIRDLRPLAPLITCRHAILFTDILKTAAQHVTRYRSNRDDRPTSTIVVLTFGPRRPSNVTWLVLIARRIGLEYSFSGRGMLHTSSAFHMRFASRACSTPTSVSSGSAVIDN